MAENLKRSSAAGKSAKAGSRPNKVGIESPEKAGPSPLTVGIVVAVVSAVLAVIGAVVAAQILKPKPGRDEVVTAVPRRPHGFSFQVGGREISGTSYSAFEKAQGFYARVEGCERNGIENVFSVVSCYITIKATATLTISNSRNITAAIYDDGTVATICCLTVGNAESTPLYRIKVPAGDVERYTYQRESELHIGLSIPNFDDSRRLDAISFSPGEAIPPVVLPIPLIMGGKVFTQEFIAAHKDDPEVQELLKDAEKMRSEHPALEKRNLGLTYAPL